MTTTASRPALQTVTAIYDAFGRGDIPTIISLLDDEVTWDGDWADNYAQRTPVNHFLPRRGFDGVIAFFEALYDYTIHEFEAHDYMANERKVVAQVTIELSTPSGGRLRDEELHLWTIGPDGRVTALRHYIDTAKHLAADSGVDTTMR